MQDILDRELEPDLREKLSKLDIMGLPIWTVVDFYQEEEDTPLEEILVVMRPIIFKRFFVHIKFKQILAMSKYRVDAIAPVERKRRKPGEEIKHENLKVQERSIGILLLLINSLEFLLKEIKDDPKKLKLLNDVKFALEVSMCNPSYADLKPAEQGDPFRESGIRQWLRVKYSS